METKDIRRINLRRLMNEYVREGKTTKAEFADKANLPPSQLSQLTSEKEVRNIGDLIARRIEDSLGLLRGWLDVPHDDIQSPHAADRDSEYSLQNYSRNYTDHTYRIEQLDMEFSCGGGRMNPDYPDIIQSIEIDPEYAKRMFGGRPATSLKITTAVGDSMRGSIDPGDLVVLDITVNRYVSDGIYAFAYGDSIHIKRLQLLKDRLMVISDNKTYERWEIGAEDEDQFYIQGFVVGKWEMSYTRLG